MLSSFIAEALLGPDMVHEVQSVSSETILYGSTVGFRLASDPPRLGGATMCAMQTTFVALNGGVMLLFCEKSLVAWAPPVDRAEIWSAWRDVKGRGLKVLTERMQSPATCPVPGVTPAGFGCSPG